MIDKGWARKLVGGCSHSIPVVVPCDDCAAARIERWRSGMIEEFKREMKNELEAQGKLVADRVAAAEKTEKTNERLLALVRQLESANEELVRRLAATRKDLDEATARLAAADKVRSIRQVVYE